MANLPRPRFLLLVATVLVAGLASLVVFPVVADFPVQEWRYFKPIVLPEGRAEEPLIEVFPDQNIFAHAAPKLSDLRVLEVDSQREVPYKLLVERGEQRRSSIALTMRDLGHVPDQYTIFVADLKQTDVLHNELEVRTQSQNFQRRVVVEGSPDSETWTVLQEKGQIFDFTIKERTFTTRYTRVRYPPSTARYLRIRVINGEESPLNITGVLAYFAQELAPRETEISATVVTRKENVKERKTIVVLDLGSPGFPTNRMVVTTPQDNFYRQVRLEGSNDAQTWTLVQGSAVLYAYNTPKFVGNKLSFNYSETTFRYFRLTIFNEDNPPLPVTSARAYGFLRKLIFSASPGSTYRLYYGKSIAHTPSYDLERIFPFLVTENLPRAQLGAHTANPIYTPHTEPFTERYAWLLPTVTAVAALLIGLFLANLLRQIRTLLPPPNSS